MCEQRKQRRPSLSGSSGVPARLCASFVHSTASFLMPWPDIRVSVQDRPVTQDNDDSEKRKRMQRPRQRGPTVGSPSLGATTLVFTHPMHPHHLPNFPSASTRALSPLGLQSISQRKRKARRTGPALANARCAANDCAVAPLDTAKCTQPGYRKWGLRNQPSGLELGIRNWGGGMEACPLAPCTGRVWHWHGMAQKA